MVPVEGLVIVARDEKVVDPVRESALVFSLDCLPGLIERVAAARPNGMDSKSLADITLRRYPGQVVQDYHAQSQQPDFCHSTFFHENFAVPQAETVERTRAASLDEHIRKGWQALSYHEPVDRGTYLGTPHPHLKPGDRFREGYYWDLEDGVSGLLAEAADETDADERNKKVGLVRNIADNLAHQIQKYGYVPNGQRTYYLGRSQPPVFASIVDQLANFYDNEKDRREVVETYLPAIVDEYHWWHEGVDQLSFDKGQLAHRRVVLMPDGSVLNRHWDDASGPRFESLHEDLQTASQVGEDKSEQLYKDIRAAAESGKDFTARFMTDPERLESIHTTDFVTPELNSLLYQYETFIAKAHQESGRSVLAEEFWEKAGRRQAAMNKYLYNQTDGFYYDYDFVRGEQSTIKSMAAAYPVNRGVASPEQGRKVVKVLGRDCLKRGGFVSALVDSPQQWDTKNGWPKDVREGVLAAYRVGDKLLAMTAISRWLHRNEKIFEMTGQLPEKANVVSEQPKIGDGGEYRPQLGFLWSNGTYRLLDHMLRRM